jgi:hypothetical protein
MRLNQFIIDHCKLFCIFVVLLLAGRWGDLRNFFSFMKNPEELKIMEADFDVYYPYADEDFWDN